MTDKPKTLAEWSSAVRARDGVCVSCGVTHPLIAHHIKEKSKYPELKLDIKNGIALCCNCHYNHHAAHPVSQNEVSRSKKKTKMAALWAENKRLKEELKIAKRLVSDISEKPLPRFLQTQIEIARLKAVIFEYEKK